MNATFFYFSDGNTIDEFNSAFKVSQLTETWPPEIMVSGYVSESVLDVESFITGDYLYSFLKPPSRARVHWDRLPVHTG